MENYLNNVIPEFTDSFDESGRETWFDGLILIIENAKKMVSD